MKHLFILLIFVVNSLFAQTNEEKAILKILETQQNAWNTGNLEKFMEGYWKSDSLKFIGKNGIQYGWQKTLDNYKKSYPTAEKMGKLQFTIISIELAGKENAFVIGQWHLIRSEGDLKGYFTLFWKKINGTWLIVADHSS
jgi:hypothetical protein